MTQTGITHLAVASEHLRRCVDPAQLPLTTADVPPLEGTIGQPRALDAIAFGLEISSPGYHLFVAGPAGSGRERTIHDFLRHFAPGRPSPSDWVYVYNFDQPDHPHVIRLPQGQGRRLAADLDGFLQAAQRDIPRAFESEDYAHRRHEALSELQEQRNALFDHLQSDAADQGYTIEVTPTGIVVLPLHQGKPLSDEEFQHLPAQQQQALTQRSTSGAHC